MSNEGFDAGKDAELARSEYPSPIARPLAFLAAAHGEEIGARGEAFVEALLRYLAIIALRGAIANDREEGRRLAKEFSGPASKGLWLERFRHAMAAWDDQAAITLLGPADATGRNFGKSVLHRKLARLVKVRNEAKYRSGAAREILPAALEVLGEAWALREQQLFVPRAVEHQSGGLKRYRATLYRGHAEPFRAISLETDLELELDRVYLARRGTRQILPLDPLVLSAPVGSGHDLFVVDRVDQEQCVATSVVQGAHLDEPRAREARSSLENLLLGFAPQPSWLAASRLSSDDNLPSGSRHYAAGELIGSRYRIVARLSSGASADVYVARDEQAGHREVALKVLPFELARSASNLAKLRNEAAVAMKAVHENLVAILGHGVDRGDAYLVLELADGWPVGDDRARDLASCLSKRSELGLGPLGEADVRALADDLARGLGALHASGTLHRDIEPSNVLLFGNRGGERAHAKLADFGISRPTDAVTTTTSAGFRVGTCRYMAPERFDHARKREVGEASDIYALGCVLYESLAGKPPFDAVTEREIEQQHRSLKPTSLLGLRPDVSPTFCALIHRCLAKTPSKRPQSARDVVSGLQDPTFVPVEDDEPPAIPSWRARGLPIPAKKRRLTWMVIGVLASIGAWIGYVGTHPTQAKSDESSNDAESYASSIVQVICEDRTPERVHALLIDLIKLVSDHRRKLAAQPDSAQQSTQIVVDIGESLRRDARLGCVIDGLTSLIQSGSYPEFENSEDLWRLVTRIASEAMSVPSARANLDGLGRACSTLPENDTTLRFVASVRVMPLENEWKSINLRQPDGVDDEETIGRLRALVPRCEEALTPVPPRLRHDQDGLRALALARLARSDAAFREKAVKALKDFVDPAYVENVHSVIQSVYPPDRLPRELEAFELRRLDALKALEGLSP